MKYLIKLCDRFRLLQSELDYHFLRASMVLIFLFFGYQKWWEYEAQVNSLYQQRPSDFLDVPCFRHPGSHLVPGGFGVGVRRTSILGILEQKGGSSWRPRRMCFIRIHNDNHSVLSGWLGSICRWISSNEGERGIPDERLGPPCRVLLSAETGFIETLTGPVPRNDSIRRCPN